MNTVIRTGFLATLITGMTLVVLPVHAQDLEHVKPVIERALPKIPARITGSVRMRVRASRRAYWRCSSSIPETSL